jgi:hypothetical protein
VSAKSKVVVVGDPAGLDQLLLAAGKGCARFLEAALREKCGATVNIWDGKDGLGAVLEEHLSAVGVPNKRLPDLLTPRAVLEAGGVLKFAPRRPYYPNGVKRRPKNTARRLKR